MTNKEIDDAVEMLQPKLAGMYQAGDNNIRERVKFYVFGDSNQFLLADTLMNVRYLFDGAKWHEQGRWKLFPQRTT